MGKKRVASKVAPLMKEGNWVVHLIHTWETDAGDNIINSYFVGVYNNAQVAYYRGNEFAANGEELFKESGNGECPRLMALELIGKDGVYPKNIEEQFVFEFFPDQNGPYMDIHGVTRPTYMLARKEELKGLVEVSDPVKVPLTDTENELLGTLGLNM